MSRLADEAAYFGAVEDGARSRDEEVDKLKSAMKRAVHHLILGQVASARKTLDDALKEAST
jgi:hypothetical protein